MTLEDADALIATYLSTHWTTTPIAWANVDPRAFSQPGQPLLPDGTADYVQVRSYLVSNRTVTVPAHCIRSHVQLQISVCVKAGTGVRKAKKHLSDLVKLLENATIGSSGAHIRIGTLIGAAGYFSDNGWYIEDAAFPFYFERYVAQP
ncbi:MAG: hypothetical protein EOM21_13615 [Gammaproteobacteria bacterium]|nr:hypothetical protein [Gammaproteobacteria bacterium]